MSLKKFTEKSLLKPWDIFITLLLTVPSFLPAMTFGLQQDTAATRKEAVLRTDNTEIKTFPLMAGEKSYTYVYKDRHEDYNLVGVDGDRVRAREADRGDQIYVCRGWATKSGGIIVCLPHKLVIEI